MRYILIFLLLYALPTQAQLIGEKDKIIASYDSVRKFAPREKIYIHFDKQHYLSQDTIWFKGYLVNATLLTQSKISGLVYTEIINEYGNVIETLSLPTNFGLCWGAFALNETKYKPGKYTFRAYTNWMQNFGDDHFFIREFNIYSNDLPTPSNNSINISASINKSQSNNKKTTSNQEIDIQFLPEGGTLLNDIHQKIAFKALDEFGKGLKVNGEVFDSNQNLVTKFTSNSLGMGTLEFTPKSDAVYTAKVSTNYGFFSQKLPKPKQQATTIKLNNDINSDSLSIAIYSTLPNEPLTIIGQARGVLCFIASFNANIKQRTIKISKDIFPTGVAQILILNSKKEVLNERNFFVNLNNQLTVTAKSTVMEYALRDSIPIQISVTDFNGKPLPSSFSVSVTDDAQVIKDFLNNEHILSNLLLTSDLRGTIEKPGSYFSRKDDELAGDLDALMLTQGWVSYNWDTDKKPTFKPEKEYAVTGKITNLVNKPSVNAKITLLGKNKSIIIMDAVTNQIGEFVFNNFPSLENASFIIQSLNTKGKSGTLGIEVNMLERPAINIAKPNKNPISIPADSTITEQISSKKKVYEAGIKSGILLREVNITGKRIIRGSKNLNGLGMASQIITEEDLAPIYKNTLFDVLREQVKGFREGMRRKSNTRDFFVNSDMARFVFDGVEIDFFYEPSSIIGDQQEYYNFVKSFLDYYYAEDIRGIEILASGYSFSYKSKFKNPLDENTYTFIEITTKSGAGPFLKKSANMFMLKPINYGSDKVFYSPKYASKTTSNTLPDYRSTIYWNPNVVTNAAGEASFSFYAADKKGTYTVWLEGTDTDGNFGYSTLKLTIK